MKKLLGNKSKKKDNVQIANVRNGNDKIITDPRNKRVMTVL